MKDRRPTLDYRSAGAPSVPRKRSPEESIALENLLITLVLFALVAATFALYFWTRVAYD